MLLVGRLALSENTTRRPLGAKLGQKASMMGGVSRLRCEPSARIIQTAEM